MEPMNLGELFTYLNFVTNKDTNGEPLSAESYASLLKISNSEFVEGVYKEYTELLSVEGIDIAVRFLNNSPLSRHLKTIEYNLEGQAQVLAPLPDDLYATLRAAAKRDNTWRPAELVDKGTFDKIRLNMFGKNVKRNPIFLKEKEGYRFVPRNTREAYVDYIATPPTPIFDFCIGVEDFQVYYMPVGSYITIDTTSEGTNGQTYQYHLYSSEGIIIVENVNHKDQDPDKFPLYSTSIELDWDEESKTTIIDNIISAASVKSRELDVVQTIKSNTE